MFLTTRVPTTLTEAVQFSLEYTASTKKSAGKSYIHVLTNDNEASGAQAAAAVAKPPEDAINKHLQKMLASFEIGIAACLKQLTSTCTEVLRTVNKVQVHTPHAASNVGMKSADR